MLGAYKEKIVIFRRVRQKNSVLGQRKSQKSLVVEDIQEEPSQILHDKVVSEEESIC